MVCVAAFIILLIIWLFTPALRLFGAKKQAESINKMFKKSMHCFSRRATFRACDSNFKDEIKNSILSKLIVRHKNWVKPVSAAIEVLAGLIVLITVWSVLTVIKSGLALYVYGTCDIKKPDACSLSSSEACSIDSVDSGNPITNWFTDWGEIFGAFPARLTTWKAEDFIAENQGYFKQNGVELNDNSPAALDIFDPGCIICRKSFVNQLNSGFFSKYKTYALPYVIKGENGDKFKNSDLVARYLEAVRNVDPAEKKIENPAHWEILRRIFTEKDQRGNVWQENFNGESGYLLSAKQAKEKIHEWLVEIGYSAEQINNIGEKSQSPEITAKLEKNRKIVEDQIKTKRIPTMIFNQTRHEGLFKPTDKF